MSTTLRSENVFASPIRRILFGSALILIFASCGRTDSYSSQKVLSYGGNPATASAIVSASQFAVPDGSARSFPKGIVIADRSSGKEVDGLYPGVGASDPTCCWLSSRASLTVARTGKSQKVEAIVFVPYDSYFEKSPEALTISVDGHEHSFASLGPGIHNLSFNLDPSTKAGPFKMQVVGRGWSPVKEGINGDARDLSVILNQVIVR